MTPDEKLKVVLDVIKKTAYYELEPIEQKVDINGDVLSSDMKVTIEEKFNKFD